MSILSEEEIVLQYSRKVLIISRQFFLLGGDNEDLYQEGMLGLISAIRSFRPDMNVKFETYAEKCIRSRIVDAIRSKGYSEYLSSENLIDSELDFDKSPEDLFLESERYSELLTSYKSKLSKYEFNVLEFYLSGYSYSEISAKLHKEQISIYNALQRIRRKLSVNY